MKQIVFCFKLWSSSDRLCDVGAARGPCSRSEGAPASRPANWLLSKCMRTLAAAEFFDLRLLQSRHQSFGAFDDGGDAGLLGTLSPNLEKTRAPEPVQQTIVAQKQKPEQRQKNVKTNPM